MPTRAHLHIQVVEDGLHLHVADTDLGEPMAHDLAAELGGLLDSWGQQRWTLDLNGVEALSSLLLADLLRLDSRLRAHGGRLSLRNLSPLLYEVFHICRLAKLFDAEKVG